MTRVGRRAAASVTVAATALLLFSVVAASSARAEVLGEARLPVGFGAPTIAYISFRSADPGLPFMYVTLFEGVVFTDPSQVFVASPATDPDFGVVSTLLTNGTDDFIEFNLSAGSASGPESLFFPGGGFPGASITRLTLRTEPNPDPPGGGLLVLAVEGCFGICVEKTASADPVAARGLLTYSITVSDGQFVSFPVGFQVVDVLPPGVAFESVTTPPGSACNAPGPGEPLPYQDSRVVCNIPADRTVTMTVAVRPQEAGTITNTVTATAFTSSGEVSGTDSVTTTVTAPVPINLSFAKHGREVAPGQVVYQFFVENAGPGSTTDLGIFDLDLPSSSFEFASLIVCDPVTGLPSCSPRTPPFCFVASSVVCNIGPLAPESFAILTIRGGGVSPGTRANTATVSNPITGNIDASAVVAVGQPADLSVAITDTPDPASPSTEITYRIDVANAGPSLATAVLVEFVPPGPQPPFLTMMGGDGWTCTWPTRIAPVRCTRPELPVGSARPIMINAFAPPDFGSAVATVTAFASNLDPEPASNLASAETRLGVPPTANAGADQQVNEGGGRVTLQGSGGGSFLSVSWRQIAGTRVFLLDATGSFTPSFLPPLLAGGVHNETLTFELTVSNPLGSATDTVDVVVLNYNHAPVAEAGRDQRVTEGSPVNLSAAGSYDPDTDALTYLWEQVNGTGVELAGATSPSASFTAPLLPGGVSGQDETLEFQLTVSDGLLSATDTVRVIVEQVNHAPTADAGADQTKGEGSLVALNGTGSTDPDGDPLTYRWVQVTGPAVTLSDPAIAEPTFTAPVVGPGGQAIAFRLTVDDGSQSDPPATDEVTIHVQNVNDPPRCDLGRADPAVLWPPDHKLVDVRIVGVTDPDWDTVTITVTAVTQDEPVAGVGDGDTAPDAVVFAGGVRLRAERAQNGNGRVYRVHFSADDHRLDGPCTGIVTVGVPPNLSGIEAVDDHDLSSFDSTSLP